MKKSHKRPPQSFYTGFWLFITAVTSLFFLEASRELLGAIYNLNLATMSINSSVIAIFAFFSPLALVLGLKKVHPRFLVLSGGVVLAVCRAAIALNPPVYPYLLFAVAAVAGFGILACAAITLLGNQYSLKDASLIGAWGVTIGALTDLSFRALGNTFDITVYEFFAQRPLAMTLAVSVIVVVFSWYYSADQVTAGRNNSTIRPLLGVGLGVIGFLYFTLLGYPNNISHWVGGSYSFAALLAATALGGALLLLSGFFPNVRERLQCFKNALVQTTVLAISVVVIVGFPHPVLSVILAAAALFVLPLILFNILSYLMQPGATIGQISSFLFAAALSFVVLLLLSVFCLTHAYVPGMDILRNQIGTILVVASLVGWVSTAVIWIWYSKKLPSSSIVLFSSPGQRLFSIFLVLVLVGSIWGGAFFYQADPQPVAEEHLVVMTYNIHQGYNTSGKIDPYQLLEPIRRVNPDILALQESDMNRISSTNVDIVQWLAHKLDMYVYFGPETRNQIYGVAILSKVPLYNTETYYLTSIEDQRVLVRADITWADRPISIYAVHMGLSEADRTVQASEIMSILSENQNLKILMGDLNSVPNSSQIAQFTAVLNDAWTSSGHELLDPLGYTSSSLEPSRRIDYILVSPQIAVISCKVIQGFGSDHLPVWAEIEIVQ